MSSTIFYRFRSQKNTSRILFDGTGITVFDLKKEIISENKLGDGTQFDLKIYNNDTEEEYADDTVVIPRATSVIARRSPPSKPGKGNGSRYITGKPKITKVHLANTNSSTTAVPIASNADINDESMTEEERISMMFANQDDQWKQTQQAMSSATPVYNKQTQSTANSNNPDDVPPPGYMCYRCGSKDHWIKNCPTNDDPNWEGKRIKRTTGIPKTYLKTVEKPEDDPTKTYLMNEEGKFVVQVADEKAWDAYKKKVNKSSDFDNLKDSIDPSLLDPITQKIMDDPVKTPCCSKLYSRTSIENALLDADFVCPNCSKEDIFLDQLQNDEETKRKIDEILEKEMEKRGIKRPLSEDSAEGNESNKKQNTGLPIKPNDNTNGNANLPMPPINPFMMPPINPFMMPPTTNNPQ